MSCPAAVGRPRMAGTRSAYRVHRAGAKPGAGVPVARTSALRRWSTAARSPLENCDEAPSTCSRKGLSDARALKFRASPPHTRRSSPRSCATPSRTGKERGAGRQRGRIQLVRADANGLQADVRPDRVESPVRDSLCDRCGSTEPRSRSERGRGFRRCEQPAGCTVPVLRPVEPQTVSQLCGMSASRWPHAGVDPYICRCYVSLLSIVSAWRTR